MLTPRTKQKLQAMINETINALCEDFPEITTLQDLKEAQKFLRKNLKRDMKTQACSFIPPEQDD